MPGLLSSLAILHTQASEPQLPPQKGVWESSENTVPRPHPNLPLVMGSGQVTSVFYFKVSR